MECGGKSRAGSRDHLIFEHCTEDLGFCGWLAVILCGFWTFCNFSWAFWFVVKVAVIIKLGHITGKKYKGPDILFTKDSVTMFVDGEVYFRVRDQISPVTIISNEDYANLLLAQTTTRNDLGTKIQVDLLSDHENISNNMPAILYEATDSSGIKMEHREIKDVKLPHQLQRAMAAETEGS
ncbi:hypothetical protein DPEC_G00230440 [Dallia pectoralis]|uniref:Uncharacterized protein n=1 Tax=Dallia pectoralis TaxID=75939 RepID=A0ACC2G216_DALPE|nr:hypothetical protein DPEC_G00230440 [Dallia pectoralis]